MSAEHIIEHLHERLLNVERHQASLEQKFLLIMQGIEKVVEASIVLGTSKLTWSPDSHLVIHDYGE